MLVLLDRDGVLNEDRTDSVKSPAEYRAITGSTEAVSALNREGHTVAVVTNQAVVGRGTIDETMLAQIHKKMQAILDREGARLDAVLVCTDPPWAATGRRKPAPGMLIEAMTQFNARAEDTVMIGDARRDLEAAATAGCRSILVRTGKGRATEAAGVPHDVAPAAVCDDLAAAVQWLTCPARG
jgi:D-glycero-D-manno-heptose 1,7-bisphosphate phosphatase